MMKSTKSISAVAVTAFAIIASPLLNILNCDAFQASVHRFSILTKSTSTITTSNIISRRRYDQSESILFKHRRFPSAAGSTPSSLYSTSSATDHRFAAHDMSNSTKCDFANEEFSSLPTTAKILHVQQQVKNVVSETKEDIIQKTPGVLKKCLHKVVAPEMRMDVKRRLLCYKSDWVDGLDKKRQTIPAILFLYFACLTPAISFGTIANEITNGAMGVVEFLLSCGISGMSYAIFCGQPMAFLAPTGLTLAFISGLFRFCSVTNLPFMPVYTWVGLWTGLFMTFLALGGSSKLIRFCTRFTDEVFNGLLSLNFIYEAVASLQRNFVVAKDPMNLTMPFISLCLALNTFWLTMKSQAIKTSIYFNEKTRTIIKDFGPVAIIFATSIINQLAPFKKFAVPTLQVPNSFELSGCRDFLVPFNSIPMSVKLLCSLPALLLTSLFFMDQNISARVVNNPENKLKKGEAYNLDMAALGLITAVASVFGMPWMCGATVQSVNHVRAMSTTVVNDETGLEEVTEVIETRLTGFVIHALLASTVFLLPLLKFLPIPVVSGVFLYLGRKLMTGNTFLQRVKALFVSPSKLPEDHPVHIVGRKKMNSYTLLQFACLSGIWAFKQCSATAIFFPSVIGLLMLIRSKLLPRFYAEKDFVALRDETPS